jgi:hypothetical protein
MATSDEAYLQTHDLLFYLEDAVASVLRSAASGSTEAPVDVLAAYFASGSCSEEKKKKRGKNQEPSSANRS